MFPLGSVDETDLNFTLRTQVRIDVFLQIKYVNYKKYSIFAHYFSI
jgi:hypothetical protein